MKYDYGLTDQGLLAEMLHRLHRYVQLAETAERAGNRIMALEIIAAVSELQIATNRFVAASNFLLLWPEEPAATDVAKTEKAG